MLSLQVSVAEWRKGCQVSFYMHSEVVTAVIQERLPGDRQGPCRDRVDLSSSVHSGFGLAPRPGTSPTGPCRDRLVTAVCREETLVILLPVVITLDHPGLPKFIVRGHPASHPGMYERGFTSNVPTPISACFERWWR